MYEYLALIDMRHCIGRCEINFNTINNLNIFTLKVYYYKSCLIKLILKPIINIF
jgi:hypothetical protein